MGLNSTGDFCYIELGTVKYHMECCKGKPYYQLQEDGYITTMHFGIRHQLTFQFARNDGTSLQWHHIHT